MKGLSFILALLDAVPNVIVVATTGALALSVFYKFDNSVVRAVLLSSLFLGAMATPSGGGGGTEGAVSYAATALVAMLARKLYHAALARSHVPGVLHPQGLSTLPIWVLAVYMLVETHAVIAKIVAGLYDNVSDSTSA